MADLKIAPGSVPVAGLGMAAEGAVLSPIEIMHRLSEQWLNGASAGERAETLRVLLKNDRFSASLLRMMEGELGEKIVDMPLNKIPKAVMKAAGNPKKQAQFTQYLRMMRGFKNGASPNDLRKTFGLAMRAAKQSGMSPQMLDALKRTGPKGLFTKGPTNVARVYDAAIRDPFARKLMRWATGGAVGGTLKGLSENLRTQIGGLEGIAQSKLSEEVGAAEGAFGKTKAGARGVGKRAIAALSPEGASAADEGILGGLKKAGAKGVGKGARLLRKAGSFGTVAGGAALGYELYDSLVGKSKRARAALEASRRGGTVSVSQELMYDILDKKADLSARRAMLARDPELMQQITQAMGSTQSRTLTRSEVGYGVDQGQQGTSPGDMDKLMEQLLGQMRGM
jgi:hypothetical protein